MMTKLFVAAAALVLLTSGADAQTKVGGVALSGPMSAIESTTTTHDRQYYRLAAPTPDNFSQPPKRAAGTREEVATRRGNTALPTQSVTYNHCGPGFVYDRHEGCTARR